MAAYIACTRSRSAPSVARVAAHGPVGAEHVTTRCTLIPSALVLGGVKVGILLVLLIYMFAVLGHGFIGTSGTLLSDPQSKEG